jgi:hypothetical protein
MINAILETHTFNVGREDAKEGRAGINEEECQGRKEGRKDAKEGRMPRKEGIKEQCQGGSKGPRPSPVKTM